LPAAGCNPFEGEAPRTFNGLRFGVILVVLLFGGYIGYYAFSSTGPTEPKKDPATARAEQQKRMQEQVAEAYKQDGERMKEMRESWEKAPNVEPMSPPTGWKSIKTPECKMTGSSLNPSTGQMTPNYDCK
jgi:hypothetical protein